MLVRVKPTSRSLPLVLVIMSTSRSHLPTSQSLPIVSVVMRNLTPSALNSSTSRLGICRSFSSKEGEEEEAEEDEDEAEEAEEEEEEENSQPPQTLKTDLTRMERLTICRRRDKGIS